MCDKCGEIHIFNINYVQIYTFSAHKPKLQHNIYKHDLRTINILLNINYEIIFFLNFVLYTR